MIISKIGLFSFGVWATLNIISTLGYYIDFGIILSVVKIVSSKNQNINKKKLTISTGLFLALINIFLFSSILFISKSFAIDLLNLEKIKSIDTLFSISILLMAVISLQNYLRLTISGIDKFIISNIMFSFSEIIRVSLIILHINKLTVEKLILFQILSLSILIIIYLGYLLYQKMISLNFFDINIIREIFSYSKFIAGIRFFDFSFFPIIKIIITNLHGLAFVGIFDLSFKLVNFAVGVISNVLFFLFPDVSSKSNDLNYVSSYLESFKKLSYILIPMFIALISLVYLNKNIISIYLTSEVNDLLIFSLMMGLAYVAIECLDKPINLLLYGLNKPNIVLKMRNIQLILTFLLIFIFKDSFLAIIFILVFCLLLSKTIYIKFFRNLILN